MRNPCNLIATCFKFSWRLLNFIRRFVTSFICLFLIFIAASSYFAYKSEKKSTSQYHGALLIDLQGVIVDQVSIPNPLGKMSRELLGSSSKRMQENSLFDIVNIIRRSTYDDKITGIVLQLDNLIGSDQPSLQYIGKALIEFKQAGKPIYAVGNGYNQSQYYLASFANHIYMSQHGHVGIYGFSTNKLFYKTLLDNLKVNSHIFRVGTYKSAVEPFIRDNMSPEAREADKVWIGSLWQHYLSTVAQNRQMTPENIFPGADKLIEEMKSVNGDSAQYAFKQKLIDHIFTGAVMEKELSNKFGWNDKEQHFNYISIYNYANEQPQQNQLMLQKESDEQAGNIAVIIAQGAIIDGSQEPGMVGSETTVAQIRKARLNPDIKAIVLRVNSPGGSVTASEAIRNELVAVREANKPIVVSMGGMAASGGYWISTPANYIFASPTTLTGSIGIFGVINTFEKSLDTLGVYTDGVSTTPLADISATKGINKQFSDMMQITIENGYNTFLKYVAQARHKTPAEIDKIAQGRVWIGSDALQNGLVDKLGDFDDAVNKAAELAKVTTPSLDWMQPERSFIDQLILELTSSAESMMPNTLQLLLPQKTANDLQQQIKFYQHMNDPQNRYAFCLNCGEVY
ncbi:signal peptide peptidase SppA [Arsenophonus endosymbiont of Aphis craccivora]|uniref:signal peptide peptidase SppA n=1 Tax=Arsenophonus endosymbiont of Aphis craccivora TaxID=1231049 RepID=UPI0015DCEF04|nr:signal peptide peptidase SppA [Arsenophonus endosymbiont of Aphis craccivora]QLK88414.1 signal peptide peptidase SppA [Arsenophonus endosymbiont of Aphis craccivora]